MQNMFFGLFCKDIGMKSKIRLLIVISFSLLSSVLHVNAADLTVTVNASTYIRPIPETMYGTNMQCWDSKQNGSNENVNALIETSGNRYVRWPGGSWGNGALWSDMEGPNYSQTWRVSYGESMYRINKFDSIMQPIVNFPGIWFDVEHGDACAISVAAAWVAEQSSRTNCARYWEIGNEIGGPWEVGWFKGISGSYYGDLFAQFSNAMKAINPGIKIGACAEPYDTPQSWDWYEGLWTRDLLNTADINYDVRPDFLIIHSYPGSYQDALYNSTLLSSDVMLISDFTASLNDIISTSIGPQYVGKIKYWMTEWDTGATDTYNRGKAYISVLFNIQYVLEMCKYGWGGSNTWSQNIYYMDEAGYPNYYVFPRWYASPILNHYFGRDMVAASSTNSMVRAYASRNDANNLTVIMANNYSSTNQTVHIDISGFSAGTTGQKWLIQPAGSIIPGGINIQDYNDLMINDVIHPEPSTIASLSGVSITTGDSFDISLPKSSILIIKIPPENPTDQLPYGGVVRSIPGTIEAEDYDTGGKFVAYYDTTEANRGGQCRSDDVDIETCSEGGYDVTGICPGEWLEYSVDVNSSGLYKITTRVASADSNGEFRIEFNGRDETGPVLFSATGEEQIFSDTDVNVFLKKGEYTMRLLMDTKGWSINKLTFTKFGNGNGSALREFWTGISGTVVNSLTSDVNYPYNPSGSELIKSFEGPTGWADYYGTRIRGYLHPVTTGIYYFYIANDDGGDLWLSTDDNPANAVKICQVSNCVNAYQWDSSAEQKSAAIALVAGQKYYIEARHKEHDGGDSIAIGWEGPGIIRQVITGPYLSPYIIKND